MTAQTIERIEGPLDHAIFLPMVSVINQLPDDAQLKSLSYPEIHEVLEARDLLYSVKHPLGVVVALAGATIEQDGKVIRLTEIAATSRAETAATYAMMSQLVHHAKDQGVDQLVLDVTPQPGTTAAEFVDRFSMAPDQQGSYILRLADVTIGTIHD